jgi:hypothetical protein
MLTRVAAMTPGQSDVVARPTKKKPRNVRGSFLDDALFGYRWPEPGPVGANVDPLGEVLGASVFPDGLLGFAAVEPVLLPVPIPVVFPPVDDPVVLPLMEVPPVVEPAPVELAAPPVCASANVLDSAKVAARAIVVSFIVCVPYALFQPAQLAANVLCSGSRAHVKARALFHSPRPGRRDDIGFINGTRDRSSRAGSASSSIGQYLPMRGASGRN